MCGNHALVSARDDGSKIWSHLGCPSCRERASWCGAATARSWVNSFGSTSGIVTMLTVAHSFSPVTRRNTSSQVYSLYSSALSRNQASPLDSEHLKERSRPLMRAGQAVAVSALGFAD